MSWRDGCSLKKYYVFEEGVTINKMLTKWEDLREADLNREKLLIVLKGAFRRKIKT